MFVTSNETFSVSQTFSTSKVEDIEEKSPKRKESFWNHIIDVNILLVVRCYVLNV